MKKLFTTLFLAVLVAFTANSQTQYFYTVIANPTKTINYDFGFYPSVMSYVEAEGVAPYTKIKAGVFNREGADAFTSKDDKVMILLKSGKLVRNYTTKATDGDFAVNYTTPAGGQHIQYYCFSGKVTREDIDRVWYILSDNQIFELKTAVTKPANNNDSASASN